jgi:hypothetical protein
MDNYSVHHQEATKDHSASTGIHLLFIPPDMTDELQAWNRFVFEVMKSSCLSSYRRVCQENPEAIMDKQMPTVLLIRTWEAINPKVIDEAWGIYDAELESWNLK